MRRMCLYALVFLSIAIFYSCDRIKSPLSKMKEQTIPISQKSMIAQKKSSTKLPEGPPIQIAGNLSLIKVGLVQSEYFDNSLVIVDVTDRTLLTYSMGYLQEFSLDGILVRKKMLFDLRKYSKENSELPKDSVYYRDFTIEGQLWGVFDNRTILMLFEGSDEVGEPLFGQIPVDEVFNKPESDRINGSLRLHPYSIMDWNRERGFRADYLVENTKEKYHVDIITNLDSKIIPLGDKRFQIDFFHYDDTRNRNIEIDFSDFPVAVFTDINRVQLHLILHDIYYFYDNVIKSDILFDVQNNKKMLVPGNVTSGPTAETSIKHIRTSFGDYSPIYKTSNKGLFLYDTGRTETYLMQENPWKIEDLKRYSEWFINMMFDEYKGGYYEFYGLSIGLGFTHENFFLPYRKQSYPVDLRYYDRESGTFHDIPIKVYACQTPYPYRVSLDGKYLAVPEQAEDGSFGHVGIYRIELK